MKALAMAGFGVLAAAFAALFAIGIYATVTDEEAQDPPDVAARKAECKKLERHLFEILPEGAGKSPDKVVPVEDIDLCSAAYPESVACMEAARDVAGVRACVPEPVECKPGTTVVDGTRPIYEVVGDCDVVNVKTSHAFVVLKAGKRAEIAGDDNVIQVATKKDRPKPDVVDQGRGNRVK